MNAYTIKRSEPRVKTSYNSSYNIQSYGDDNLYPQRMKKLILNSPTGATCLERYQTFIEGNGLYDTKFSEFVCNRAGQTVDDILRLIASDIAYHNGFALRVYYDLTCKITDLQYIPFECCRLEEEDDAGGVSFINYHVDWSGNKTRKGKKVEVNKKNIRKYYRFNPIPEVVRSEMMKDGVFGEKIDVTKYRGQMIWVSLDGNNIYPRSIYDKVATNLSTDEALDNIKYRNTRNNFFMSGMLVRKTGTGSYRESEDEEESTSLADDEFTKALEEFQGDDKACAIMEVQIATDEEKPEFVKFESVNFDAKFQTTEASTTERIYSAFGQEPWYTLRIGKVGFSGDILAQAYEYYNSYVASQRRAISRCLQKVFENWREGEAKANASKNYDIQPLVYVTNENSNA